MKLFPRDDEFFSILTRAAANMDQAASTFRAILEPGADRKTQHETLSKLEHEGDLMTHELIDRLNRTFITPIDREDIHALARTLDDVMDAIDAAATLLPLYEIRSVRHGARELAAVIARQTEKLRQAIDAMQQRDEVYERIREIHTLEHEADIIHREAVRQLFKEERDPIVVMKWKEIVDLLEAATDAAEAAADVIEGIVVKHA